MARMKFATIDRSIIIKKLGRITPIDQDALKSELQTFFGMNSE
jgi:hypothetical protein